MTATALLLLMLPLQDPVHPIDAYFERIWKEQGLSPAAPAGAHEFLRRLTLDLLGRLPKPDEVRAFEKDPDRTRKIDELLASDEAAEFSADTWMRVLLAYKFEETLPLKINFPAFRAWLRDAAKKDLPHRDFARALISDTGDYKQKPASNFILAALDPMEPPHEVTNRMTRVFLGLQLQCARCHDHPFEKYTQEDFWGLTAFFSGVKPKSRQTFDGFGVKLMADAAPGMMAIPDSKTEVPARFLDGRRPAGDAAPLKSLADWVTGHPQFARAIVNRVWAHLMGRGFVEPVDKFTDKSRASHPELFEQLAAGFLGNDSRVRPLLRLILTSKAYQAGSAPAAGTPPESHAAMLLKPMTPVQLLNVLSYSLNMEVFLQEFYKQFTANKDLPETYRNPEVFRMFLHLYMQGLLAPGGQAPEESRYAGSVRLALKLMNSHDLQNLVKAEWGRLAEVMKREMSPEGRLDGIFLTLLSRPPSTGERTRYLEYTARKKGRKEAFEDVYWVLLNSTEFIFNH